MIPPEDRFEPLGTHLVYIEGDTLIMIARGLGTVDDVNTLFDHLLRIRKEHGPPFLLYDARRATGIEPRARRIIAQERSHDSDSRLRVVFGVHLAVRVILNMTMRGRRALGNPNSNVHFLDKEQEAWAFFEKERARLRQEWQYRKSP